ncbi:hypothetical protein [Haloquadratum walsbyi]|uniref:hypothetical protein n=1 Tax=Haloquadratum walsbyi TaxID=293091 RepID=UPI0023F43B03|nr:hypothetical protein [Haloquadratum walsbyi]
MSEQSVLQRRISSARRRIGERSVWVGVIGTVCLAAGGFELGGILLASTAVAVGLLWAIISTPGAIVAAVIAVVGTTTPQTIPVQFDTTMSAISLAPIGIGAILWGVGMSVFIIEPAVVASGHHSAFVRRWSIILLGAGWVGVAGVYIADIVLWQIVFVGAGAVIFLSGVINRVTMLWIEPNERDQ